MPRLVRRAVSIDRVLVCGYWQHPLQRKYSQFIVPLFAQLQTPKWHYPGPNISHEINSRRSSSTLLATTGKSIRDSHIACVPWSWRRSGQRMTYSVEYHYMTKRTKEQWVSWPSTKFRRSRMWVSFQQGCIKFTDLMFGSSEGGNAPPITINLWSQLPDWITAPDYQNRTNVSLSRPTRHCLWHFRWRQLTCPGLSRAVKTVST